MILRFQHCNFPKSISKSNLHHRNALIISQKFHINPPKSLAKPKPIITNRSQTLFPICKIKAQSSSSQISSDDSIGVQKTSKNEVLNRTHDPNKGKNFWAAVSLIIGTAVGPGMLGLPAATIRSGSIPSTLAILVSWVYVISSIILVAELSFAAMEEDNSSEVSFTSLATKSLGKKIGTFIALVYASLSFSLMVACVSGIGSIISQLFPSMNFILANLLFPLAVGILIGFFPFKAIDFANRSLCALMLLSITSLVAVGLSVARTNVLASFAHSSFRVSSVLPAVPVIVLTLGFHVITPFICKIAGDSVSDARKAILIGGVVPLLMVLSWNLIVLGLARTNLPVSSSLDPISLLLSVNPSALLAVQGFAFSALATSLIGYTVSFPKQILDTWSLMFRESKGNGRIGFARFCSSTDNRNVGRTSYCESESSNRVVGFESMETVVMMIVLIFPALIASFFTSSFSRALDFAGIYANCLLFGVLPPAMAFIQKSKNKLRSSILPGGNAALLLLFSIAVVLGIWH